MLGVEFRRFAGMMSGMLGVTLRGVRMVSCGFVIAGLMLLSGFTMMTCCVLVMLCCLIVVVRCFLRHIESPWIANNWASRPEARVHAGSGRGHTLFSRRRLRDGSDAQREAAWTRWLRPL
jgi:hypothetical protein